MQDALDAAEPGDAIGVADGRYEGGVTMRTDGVTCSAARSHSPVIYASGAGTGVQIRASDVTVDGFETVGDADTTSGISIATSDGGTADAPPTTTCLSTRSTSEPILRRSTATATARMLSSGATG